MFTAFHALSPKAQVTLAVGLSVLLCAAGLTGILILVRSDMSRLEKGQLLMLVTTVGGFAGGYLREARNRAWAIADREAGLKQQTAEIISKAQAEATALLISTEAKERALRVHLEAAAERIRKDTLGAAERIRVDTLDAAERIRLDTLGAAAVLREEQRVNAEILATEIADVKVEAKRAYQEANHVNGKIEDLNKRLLKEEQAPARQPASDGTDQKLDALQVTANEIDVKVDALTESKDTK